MASIILAYGVALAVLSLFVQQLVPTSANVVLVAGIGGGGASVVWGVVALMGHKRRAWAVLTLIPVAFVTLSQVLQAWMASSDSASTSLAGRLALTLMFLMTVGMLMYLLHGERSPEFYQTGTTPRDHSPSRDNDARSESGRNPFK